MFLLPINYFLTSSDEIQKCEKIESKCTYQEMVNNTEICFMCKPSIMIKDGKCDDSENKCQIENCYACRFAKDGVNEECVLCKNGFASTGGKCQDTNGKLKNCWMYDGINNDVCNTCMVGYFLNDNGRCEKSEKYDMNLFAFGKAFVVNFLMILIFLAN